MRIVEVQAPALFELASAKLSGHYRHEAGHRILTLMGEHGVVAQAVFTSLAPTVKAEVHIWSDERHGLSMFPLLKRGIVYVFDELRCERLQTVAPSRHGRAQELILKAGFQFEARLACWYGTDDGFMYRMLRRECRWLRN